jgi:hypothetical protein
MGTNRPSDLERVRKLGLEGDRFDVGYNGENSRRVAGIRQIIDSVRTARKA